MAMKYWAGFHPRPLDADGRTVTFKMEVEKTWPVLSIQKAPLKPGERANVTLTLWELDRWRQRKGAPVRQEIGGGRDDPLCLFHGIIGCEEGHRGRRRYFFIMGEVLTFPLTYPGPEIAIFIESLEGARMSSGRFLLGSRDDKEDNEWELSWSIQEGWVSQEAAVKTGTSSRTPHFLTVDGYGGSQTAIALIKQACINALDRVYKQVEKLRDEAWQPHATAVASCYEKAYTRFTDTLEKQAEDDAAIHEAAFALAGLVVGMAGGALGGYAAGKLVPGIGDKSNPVYWNFLGELGMLERSSRRKSLITALTGQSKKLAAWVVGEVKEWATATDEDFSIDSPLDVSGKLRNVVGAMCASVCGTIADWQAEIGGNGGDQPAFKPGDDRVFEEAAQEILASLDKPTPFEPSALAQQMEVDLWAMWLVQWLDERERVGIGPRVPGKRVWKTFVELGLLKEAGISDKEAAAELIRDSVDFTTAIGSSAGQGLRQKLAAWSTRHTAAIVKNYRSYL